MTTPVQVNCPSGSWNNLKVELIYTRDGLPVQSPIYLAAGKSCVVQVNSETQVKVTEVKS